MTDLNFNLHPKQMEVFHSEARYKAVAAGRRGGKSFFAAVWMIMEALKEVAPNGRPLDLADVWYVAPTYGQAKDIMWRLLKDLAGPVTRKPYEKDLILELVNGRRIILKGSDREETLRGVGLGALVMDEFADVKDNVFPEILQATLGDYRAPAMFIGTPKGKNHFYEYFLRGESKDPRFRQWASFRFRTADNPYIEAEEVEDARNTLSTNIFKQEYEADFAATAGAAFREDWIKIIKPHEIWPNYMNYMTMDPAGFGEVNGKVNKKLDEHAIVNVNVSPQGWDVVDIAHDRWGVREAAMRLLRQYQKHHPVAVGIEKGALKNALEPYVMDYERRMGIYLPPIQALTHGGQRKVDRVLWSLQGRFEHGQIRLVEGPWNRPFIEQLLDFPNPLVHDDLPDALAYIAQLAQVDYTPESAWVDDYWEPLDEDTGY